MKTKALLSFILSILACAQAPLATAGQEPAAQAVTWARYTYPGEEFSVELPGPPALWNAQRGVNNDWRKTEKVRIFSHYSDGVVFFVVAYDNPHRSESADFFATHLRGAWKLAPKGQATAGGVEGRAYGVVGTQRGRLTYDLHGEGRVFRARRHAYLALAISEQDGRPEVARFLDSFAVGANPSGQPVPEEAPVARFVPSKENPSTGAESGPGRGGGGGMSSDDDHRASIIYKPEPGYTEEARRSGVSGSMMLRAVLSSEGRVTEVRPVKWLSHGLTERAIRAARQIRFFPARKGGVPVSQWVILEYNFNIY